VSRATGRFCCCDCPAPPLQDSRIGAKSRSGSGKNFVVVSEEQYFSLRCRGAAPVACSRAAGRRARRAAARTFESAPSPARAAAACALSLHPRTRRTRREASHVAHNAAAQHTSFVTLRQYHFYVKASPCPPLTLRPHAQTRPAAKEGAIQFAPRPRTCGQPSTPLCAQISPFICRHPAKHHPRRSAHRYHLNVNPSNRVRRSRAATYPEHHLSMT